MPWANLSLVLAVLLMGGVRGAAIGGSTRPAARAAGARATEAAAAPWVSVTVSPLLNTKPQRQLELTWAHASPSPGDWVGLFASDPVALLKEGRGALRTLALARVEVTAAAGRRLSGVAAAADAHNVTQCAAYLRSQKDGSETVLAQECARMYPDWMGQLASSIGGLRLSEVLLPGTHDTGAYRKYANLRPQTRIEKYTVTQEEDVGTQLELGVRYLDMRVGHYPDNAHRWWINHGVVRMHPMQDALDQIKTFVLQHPTEIIIFDAQEFTAGFGQDLTVHEALVAYLTSELGELLVERSLNWSSTLNQVWAQRGRVILAYDRAEVVAAPSLAWAPLWPAVRQLWGNVQSVDKLRDYLRGYLSPGGLDTYGATAAMAELTPTSLNFIMDNLGGLRKMADSVNGPMTELLRDEWAPRTNAFAVDFVRGTDIVRVAVEFNRHRGEARHRRDTVATAYRERYANQQYDLNQPADENRGD